MSGHRPRFALDLETYTHFEDSATELLPLVTSLPVHIYIGDPLTSTTPISQYKPDKLGIPDVLEAGDPIFCADTQCFSVLGLYLHSTQDDTIFGLTIGQAVHRDGGFELHPKLAGESRRNSNRSSQRALRCLGTTLSAPAQELVEAALHAYEASNRTRRASGDESEAPAARAAARIRQQEAEYAALRDALARPHELDVGHACAAEALIRSCHGAPHHFSSLPSDPNHSPDAPATPSSPARRPRHRHTHLLSWALIRMTRKAGDNPLTLHAYPGTLTRGAPVTMSVRDPHRERPLGPHRDGVVNGAPATIVVRGHLAREWAIFPASARRGLRFAGRGDAGALVTAEAEEGSARPRPLALLYAAPERGPYGLVTPLTTVLRRIGDVTGLQLRCQGNWWRDSYH
ncbi:hypothetical protein CERSUDRAFT_96228 [Gelatoporia subvermispora B]|uniref:Uncharacterized protein n=1 Tax=Ceriporiopsis subvermispora (strain B) TaxID=914234 RepID=M2QV99_CERS8|nr:hypothetical protein CERSUDRAFT_96228 [Gelatoporia subvermispora B]